MPEETHEERETRLRLLVSRALAARGYILPQPLKRLWRHFTGPVTRDRQQFFFKMSFLPEVTLKTRNEIAWNRAVNLLAANRPELVFQVPNVYQDGEIENLPWYIGDLATGQPLVDQEVYERTGEYDLPINSLLTQVAYIPIQIMRLPLPTLPLDERYQGHQHFLTSAREWRDTVQVPEGDGLLELVETLALHFLPGLRHGDFDPWHLYREKTSLRLLLVDGESACTTTVKYYDAAYFALRIVERGGLLGRAGQFLSLFRDFLTSREREEFDRLGPAIVAYRTLGGFMDSRGNEIKTERHRHWARMLLDGKIW